MAITWLDNDVVFGSSPTWKRSVGYEETSRTATSVTYTITLKLKVQGSGTSSSFYGYPVSWSIDGGTATQIKTSTRWYGNESYRTFTKTITKSVGASGGTTSMSVKIYATGGGSMSSTFSHSLKYSTFNTAPTWPSSARLRVRENDINGYLLTEERGGTENSVKAREDVSKYYVYWDSASDNENNISRYELYTQINDGSWSLIYSGSNRYYTHNVGAGNPGYKYDYYVVAVDSYGARSGSLDTTQFQKNALTGARLTISNGIWYGTESMKLTWSGASNSNGNTSITYSISSSGLTIYNKEKLTASGGTIKILTSGTSTDPYILFEDVKNYVASSPTKTGQFNITLTTKNVYGSTVTNTATALIDARTNPKAPTTVSIGGKVSTSLGSYLIPARSNAVISWSGASDYLGGALTYDVYYKVGTGSEVLATSGTSSTSASIKLPTPTSATTVAFRVVAKTTYGYSATSSTVSDTIHFYNPPTVSIGGYNRTNTSVSLTITNAVNSSIPNVAFAKQSYTGNGVTANYTGSKYTASITGLNESSAFTFTATVNDNTGLSDDVSASFKVIPATPKFSVRERGVGVNCVNNGEASLVVQGGVLAKGSYTGTTTFTEMPVGITTQSTDKDDLGFASPYSTTLTINHSAYRQFQINADNSGNSLYFRSAHSNNTDGTGEGWSSWKKVLVDGAIDNFTINTNSVNADKGLTVRSASGVVGRIWSGSTGTVFNSMGDYNLHIGRNGSTSDMVFYKDRIETKQERVAYGSIVHDMNAGERRVAFGSGLTRYWGMYGNSDGLGWYDWKNQRSVMSYTPSTGFIDYYQTVSLSGMPSTSNGKHLTINTAHDNNGYGDAKTHIGYRTPTGYHHYFRGAGSMNINCTAGTNITGNLKVGGTVTSSKSLAVASDTYQVRLSNEEGQGAVLSYSSDDAEGSFLFSENGFSPQSDNSSYCGTTSNRWQVVYSSTGSVYSSSKDEKFDIVPLNNKVRTASLDKTTDEVIVDGIKNMNFYSYKYRTLADAGEGSSNMFVGFLGQEVEASDPDFFSLFGSSYDKVIEEPITEEEEGDEPTIIPLEEKEVKTVKQYDIREASLNGVLMVGLQQALLQIDTLKAEIEELKKGGK